MIKITYIQALIHLYTDKSSPFYGMNTFSWFNIGNILTLFFKWLGWVIGCGLSAFMNMMEEFAGYCYKFLSFSNIDELSGKGGLYDLMTSYIFIPLTICLIIIAIKYAMGNVSKGSGKQIISNVMIVIFILVVMPSVFNFMNNEVIGDTYLADIQGKIGTISDEILKNNTTDYLYLYNECDELQAAFKDGEGNDIDITGEKGRNIFTADLNNIYDKIKQLKVDYSKSEFSKECSFSSKLFDCNQVMQDGADGFECPSIYQYKPIEIASTKIENSETEQSVGLFTVIKMDTNGIFNTGLGAISYQRYNIDYFSLYLELLATALMYFCVGYSVLKLIIELIIHQIFGPFMAAMDIVGGQRIRKYIESIIGCYAGLLLSAITVLLYNKAVLFIQTMNITQGFIKGLLCICLAILMLDIPNIIARYFGINTGIRGGMGIVGMGLYATGRVASRAAGRGIRAGARGVRSGIGSGVGAAFGKAYGGTGGAGYGARHGAGAVLDERRKNQQREQQRKDDAKSKYDSEMDSYTKSKGSDGNFEKYQNPLNKKDSADGSEQRKNALAQQAAISSMQSDSIGKNLNPDEAKNAVLSDKDITDADKDAMKGIGRADIADAKYGVSKGIANDAEGQAAAENRNVTKADYQNAAQSFLEKAGRYSAGASGSEKAAQADYFADSAINTQHSAEIRTQASNIKAQTGKSDVECYAQAMKDYQNELGFSDANIEKIANSEISTYGSLRDGNIIENRPSLEYKPNSRQRGLL